MSDNKINVESVEFPEEKKTADMAALKEESAAALARRDELRFVVCRNIEMDYMLRFGEIEIDVLECQCEALRSKRRIELIRKKQQEDESFRMQEIEELLDDEFEKYSDQIDDQTEKLEAAEERKRGGFLSDKDLADLKAPYQAIVSAFHPDLNPDIAETEKAKYHAAAAAFEAGDPAAIKEIYEALTTLEAEAEEEAGDSAAQSGQMETLLDEIQTEIKEIEKSYPYNVRGMLENEAAASEHKETLMQTISCYEDMISIYRAEVDDYME
jgi:hypothetical protein